MVFLIKRFFIFLKFYITVIQAHLDNKLYFSKINYLKRYELNTKNIILSEIISESIALSPKSDMNYHIDLSYDVLQTILKLTLNNRHNKSYNYNEKLNTLLYLIYDNSIINSYRQLYWSIQIEKLEYEYRTYEDVLKKVKNIPVDNANKYGIIESIIGVHYKLKYIGGKYENIINALINIDSHTTILSYFQIGKKYKEHISKNKYLQQLENNTKSRKTDIKWDIFNAHNLKLGITLFIALFFISGFVYTFLLTFYLDIEINHFYVIYDYIESNIDNVLGILGYIALIIVYELVIINLSNESSTYIETNMFYIDIIRTLLLFIMSVLTFMIYLSDEKLIFLASSIFLIYINISNYLIYKHTNKTNIFIVVFTFYILAINIFVSIRVDEYKKDNYTSNYKVIFKKEHQEYSSLKFLFSNSNYIFLRNKNSKIVILKKDIIIGMEQTKKL